MLARRGRGQGRLAPVSLEGQDPAGTSAESAGEGVPTQGHISPEYLGFTSLCYWHAAQPVRGPWQGAAVEGKGRDEW